MARETWPLGETMRPTRDEMMMDIAHTVSKRGTCCRLKVGAVLGKDGRPISIGYNGARPGHEHCTPETCLPDSPCTNTIHAERNAINWARLEGVIDFSKMVLYVTDAPCLSCAKYIVESGIKTVYFSRPYRVMDGLEWLTSNGVSVYHLERK